MSFRSASARLYFQWVLACAFVLLCGACQERTGNSRMSGPTWARGSSGLPRRWAQGLRIDVTIPAALDQAAQGALRRAAHAWFNGPMLPKIVFHPGKRRLSAQEDGESAILFVAPGRDCSWRGDARNAGFCLTYGRYGATQLYSRPTGKFEEIIEADLLLDESLLTSPDKLYQVAVHEFGHLLGLDHPVASAGKFGGESVMWPSLREDAHSPSSSDLSSLLGLYQL